MARLPLLLAILVLASRASAAPVSLTFATLGVTYHPGGVNDTLSDHMPTKITPDGKWVRHDVEYTLHVSYNGYQASAQYLKDCFGNDAHSFTLGRDWDVWRLKAGLMGGVYIREKVWFDNGDSLTSWVDMPGTVNRGSTQYIPMVLGTLSVPVWRLSEFATLSILLAANTWVTHLTSGITMEW